MKRLRPKIAIALQAANVVELTRLVKKAQKKADLIELRLDYLDDLRNMPLSYKTLSSGTANTINKVKNNIEPLLMRIPVPTIITIRPEVEGGNFTASDQVRYLLFHDLISASNFVDIELDSRLVPGIKSISKKTGAKLIVSKHFFDHTPPLSKLKQVLHSQMACGADVCKIITHATKLQDNFTTLALVQYAAKKTKIVSFCMGELGALSRALSPLHGASFTFACLDYGKETAKGQISADDLIRIYKALR